MTTPPPEDTATPHPSSASPATSDPDMSASTSPDTATDTDTDTDTAGSSAAGPSAPSARKRRRAGWLESVLLVGGGVVAALLANVFVIGSFYIPSESMEPTLEIDDRVIVNKLSGDIGRGEVVVFTGWDGTPTVKRVIGIGGDRVKCCDADGRITVNGRPLHEESYLHPQDFPSQEKFDVTVPKEHLWLMGDHRAASEDARAHLKEPGKGTIPTSAVIGRAVARYWPLDRVATLPVPDAFSHLP
ncbi:signal peptidase I [Sphaerisporangium rubeum]|uniref:Signal peptidase I n=1 Tax=Sphaerisporangium rubeum TaxID=321317 RepID=A0A7X0M5H7_9ACTN|nr:signal peptidase I [Sphaerisporangium rubeum]MBB6472385.1 signal peptidase I [Sphaerisporangium rubeum]